MKNRKQVIWIDETSVIFEQRWRNNCIEKKYKKKQKTITSIIMVRYKGCCKFRFRNSFHINIKTNLMVWNLGPLVWKNWEKILLKSLTLSLT